MQAMALVGKRWPKYLGYGSTFETVLRNEQQSLLGPLAIATTTNNLEKSMLLSQ